MKYYENNTGNCTDSGAYTTYSFTERNVAKLDELLQACHNLGKLNGSVLVAQHGKILVEKGYGLKKFIDNTLNDSNTFCIVSR